MRKQKQTLNQHLSSSLSQVQLNSFHSKLVLSSCFWLVFSAPGWTCLYRSATHMANQLSSVQSSFPLYLEVSLALYQAVILLFFVYIVIFEIFLKMSQSYILNIIFRSTGNLNPVRYLQGKAPCVYTSTEGKGAKVPTCFFPL